MRAPLTCSSSSPCSAPQQRLPGQLCQKWLAEQGAVAEYERPAESRPSAHVRSRRYITSIDYRLEWLCPYVEEAERLKAERKRLVKDEQAATKRIVAPFQSRDRASSAVARRRRRPRATEPSARRPTPARPPVRRARVAEVREGGAALA